MPVEIRELHIRVTVESEASQKSAAKQRGAARTQAQPDQSALIAECVEQVMEIIQSQKER